MKKALFLHFLRSLLISIDNLGSGKRNCCFGRKYGKSLEFWIQRSVQTQLLYAMRVTVFSASYFFPRCFPARFFPLEKISLQDIFS